MEVVEFRLLYVLLNEQSKTCTNNKPVVDNRSLKKIPLMEILALEVTCQVSSRP